MAKIFVIMGKSSSGKDTIYNIVKKNVPELKTVTMYTTRPMRDGEHEGVEYHFVTDKEACELENKGKIIEIRSYNTVYGIWKYFTADDGQININSDEKYLVIGTLEAFEKYLLYYGKDIVEPIYIEVDDAIRIHRALEREDSQANPKYVEMCRRFVADDADFSKERLAECRIEKSFNNENLEDCVSEITDYIGKMSGYVVK